MAIDAAAVTAHFWDAERPFASVAYTAAVILISWGMIKFWSAVLWRREMAKKFPCPPYGFLTGNLPQLNELGMFEYKFFREMHKQHGPIFGFFLPPFDFHLSVDRPELMQIVHKKATERPDSTYKVVNYLYKENILFQHGEWQKKLRRSYQEIINNTDVHSTLHRSAWEALEKEIPTWGKEPVDVHTRLEHLIYELMGSVLFGEKWSAHGKGDQIMKNHLYCAQNVMKWAFLPWSPTWDKDYCKYRDSRQGFWDDISEMLNARRDELKKGTAKIDPENKDVFTLLLGAKTEDGKPFYDHPTAVSTMMVFLNGSFDTTLNSTSWTLYWLAKHPHIQERLRKEITEHLPDLEKGCIPDRNTLMDLPFLDAVIRESMRRLPAAPINMRVNLDADWTIEHELVGKITIPKGVTVVLPYECAMNKEEIFGKDCPALNTFNPDRFMGTTDNVRECRRMWTPFGDHTRMCVGRNFALVEIRLFLARIISKFNVELEEPDKKVEPSYEAGINVISCPDDKTKPRFIFKPRA